MMINSEQLSLDLASLKRSKRFEWNEQSGGIDKVKQTARVDDPAQFSSRMLRRIRLVGRMKHGRPERDLYPFLKLVSPKRESVELDSGAQSEGSETRVSSSLDSCDHSSHARQLYFAVRAGDAARFRDVMRHCTKASSDGGCGLSAERALRDASLSSEALIHTACRFGRSGIVAEMVDDWAANPHELSESVLSKKDEQSGVEAILTAAKFGHLGCVRALMQRGCVLTLNDLRILRERHCRAISNVHSLREFLKSEWSGRLLKAAERNDLGSVQFILLVNPHSDQIDSSYLHSAKDEASGNLAIHWAAHHRNEHMLRSLMEHESKQSGVPLTQVSERNHGGQTCLEIAVANAHRVCAQTLIDHATNARMSIDRMEPILEGFYDSQPSRLQKCFHKAMMVTLCRCLANPQSEVSRLYRILERLNLRFSFASQRRLISPLKLRDFFTGYNHGFLTKRDMRGMLLSRDELTGCAHDSVLFAREHGASTLATREHQSTDRLGSALQRNLLDFAVALDREIQQACDNTEPAKQRRRRLAENALRRWRDSMES